MTNAAWFWQCKSEIKELSGVRLDIVAADCTAKRLVFHRFPPKIPRRSPNCFQKRANSSHIPARFYSRITEISRP
jgi:hypothetical protein